MPSKIPKGIVAANPGKAKTFGILGIIAASAAILVCNAGTGVMLAFMPSMAKMMKTQEKEFVRRAEMERATRIDDLRDQEEAAKTAAEKKEAHDERVALETAPPIPTPPMTMGFDGYDDRRVQAVFFVDIFLNIVLNVLVIVGCAGMIGLREWGRKITVAATSLKIAECLLITVLFVMVVAPIMGGKMGARVNTLVQTMGTTAPGPAPNVPDMRSMMTIGQAAMYALFGGLGLIWPIILLVAALGGGVKGACARRRRLVERTDEKPKPGGDWESELA